MPRGHWKIHLHVTCTGPLQQSFTLIRLIRDLQQHIRSAMPPGLPVRIGIQTIPPVSNLRSSHEVFLPFPALCPCARAASKYSRRIERMKRKARNMCMVYELKSGGKGDFTLAPTSLHSRGNHRSHRRVENRDELVQVHLPHPKYLIQRGGLQLLCSHQIC